jgi:hypothetical protein
VIKVTVKGSESEINRTVERQEHVHTVNNFTEKQKRGENEAAMRYLIMAANV